LLGGHWGIDMRNFVSHSSSCLATTATTALELLKPLKSPTATTAAAATTKNVKVITFSNYKTAAGKSLSKATATTRKISAAAAVDIPSDVATETATVVATFAHANFFCCPLHRCMYDCICIKFRMWSPRC